jgi:SPP1 gp7 family putative phage head morphogenesis protein
MPDTLLTIAQRLSIASARKDADALMRLLSAYRRMYSRLAGQIELLAERVGDGQMSTGQLARLTQWQSLRGQIEGELSDFGAYTKGELSNSAQAAIERALRDSRQLISAGSDGAITVGFGALNAAQVERLLTFLAPNSALFRRLTQLAPVNAQGIADLFAEGVGLGWNPRKIAAAIRKQFGMALVDALRMTRTAQLYAYRETTRASYIESGVVDSWQWMAALNNPNVCMSCVRMHGTIHPNTERLNDHHNGRCVMLPIVRGFGNPINETGEQWFARQSEADQIGMMGREYHKAFKQGYFQFGELSRVVTNDVYGPMRNTTPLWQLLGAEPPLRMS